MRPPPSKPPNRFQGSGQFLHHLVERGFSLEADAGDLRQADPATLHLDTIGKSTEGLEYARIALVPTKAETGSDIERHLVSAMRHHPAR